MQTKEEFTRKLPVFTGDPVPIKPPMWFNNLTAKFFPLRASLDALQQLCDGYLNIVPPEIGRFRASTPYVLMGILDYGQIAESAKQIGWFAQVEVYFSISVEWYKLIDGQWVFHDFAVITPYIFVDDSFSAPLGRTVYGFPKILSHIAQVDTPWIKDCHTDITLARLETMVFQEAYSGRRLEMRPVMEITRRPPMSNLEMPFDANSPVAPWNIMQNLAETITGFGRDAAWMAQTLRITPLKDPAADPMQMMQQMMARFLPSLAPGGDGFIQNSINLKQFRLSNDPLRTCYQSLTLGRMLTTGFHGAGLLGEDRTFFGDLSGGHRVKLYSQSSLPIARVLGLEVHRTSGEGESEVLEIKPVMPFWLKLDLKYEDGTNLAWRSNKGVWKDEGGNQIEPGAVPAETGHGPYFNDTAVSAIEAIAGPFQFPGTTIRVLPLMAAKSNVQAYLDYYLNGPLNTGTIKPDFNDGPAEHVRFSVWARPEMPVRFQNHVSPDAKIGGDIAYVYITAASYNGVKSQNNNVGDWAKYELSIQIPVKFERLNTKENAWETVGVGMVPYLTLVDQPIAAISRMEVQGINALTAKFISPEDTWLGDGKSDAFGRQRQSLLRVDTEVTVAAAQKSKMNPLIEISRRDEDAGLGRSEAAPWAWSESLRRELGTKNGLKAFYPKELQIARALALELLGNWTPFAVYTLKQFRDVCDPDKACEQSLVRIPRTLNPFGLDVREIEETLVVRFHDYPTQQIVKTLGILASPVEDGTTGVVFSAQAYRPFYVRGTLTEGLTDRLMSRAGEIDWTLYKGAFDTRLNNYAPAPDKLRKMQQGPFKTMATPIGQPEPTLEKEFQMESAPYIQVTLGAERQQDMMDPSLAANNMKEAREHRDWLEKGINLPKLTDDPKPYTQRLRGKKAKAFDEGQQVDISKAQARAALNFVDPQSVIEAILSREWCNRDENARWRQGKRLLKKLTSTLAEGGTHKGDAERLIYERVNNELSLRPRSVAFRLPPRSSRTKLEDSDVPLGSVTDRHGWLTVMDAILDQNELCTVLQVKMELKLNEFCSAAIGLSEFEVSEDVQQKIKYVDDATKDLLKHLEDVAEHHILGLPSDLSHLDPEVRADNGRLIDILNELVGLPKWAEKNFWNIGELDIYIQEIREAVSLGRKHCQAQREALMNKLARAYQKPDFCVRRDSVGAERDKLLPLSFSWDEEWYCGNPVTPGKPPKISKPPDIREMKPLTPSEAGPPIKEGGAK